MKLKAASGYACYVNDLVKSIDFYKKLGLEVKNQTKDRAIIYLNWYRIDLVIADRDSQKELTNEAKSDHKGDGLFLYFSVDNVDEAYEELTSQGLKPLTKPQDKTWGNREFIVKDPDGYKIVIFKRKVAKNPTD